MTIQATTDQPTGVDPGRGAQALQWAVWLLPLHGLLLLWSTWQRQPSPSTQFAEWSQFVTTAHFEWSHLVASIGGQAGAVVGTAALTAILLSNGAPAGRTVIGLVSHLAGSSLMLAGFGIAAFAQPAIGRLHERQPALAEEMYHAVYTPVTLVTLLTGLALFSLSTIAIGSALLSLPGMRAWVGHTYAAAGPVFGIVGFVFGTFQTLGALALVVAGGMTAAALHRSRGGTGVRAVR